MTVQNTIVKNVYVGNGSVTVFPYTFALNKDDGEYVEVTLADEDGVESTVSNFKVDTTNCVITYPYPTGDPLPSGHKIAFKRIVPNTQELNLENQGPFFANDIEAALDRIVMEVQQIADDNQRAVKVSITSDITPDDLINQLHEDAAIANLAAENASTSETNAYNSEIAASASAAAAYNSEVAAGNSATAAGNSATAAGISETNAGNSATAAHNSEVAAAASELAAGNSATAAHNSELAAGASETNAGNSATASYNSEVAAASSAYSAAASASEAAGYAHSVDFRALLRQPSTAYALGTVVYLPSIGAALYLECTTPGTTASGDLVISTPTPNDTVTDGTVTWTIKKIGSGGGVPIGIIEPFAGNGQIPEGYLLCDGSAVSRTMFPDLFETIGTTYGSGDGSTTFNLPDSNQAKRFLQGDTVAGTVKSAGLPNIEGMLDGDGINQGDNGSAHTTTSGCVTSVWDQRYYGASGSTSYKTSAYYIDASLSNPIYGNSDTVQPPALTTRYIIKAFNGQTPDSALIDITQYANELAGKANRSLSNLTQAGQDSFLERDFTIIYPNGGTAENPANVSPNSVYLENSPFSGYHIAVVAEILIDNVWCETDWYYVSPSSNGMRAEEYGDQIRLVTGTASLTRGRDNNGTTSDLGSSSAPCRIKVWKIGKIPT